MPFHSTLAATADNCKVHLGPISPRGGGDRFTVFLEAGLDHKAVPAGDGTLLVEGTAADSFAFSEIFTPGTLERAVAAYLSRNPIVLADGRPDWAIGRTLSARAADGGLRIVAALDPPGRSDMASVKVGRRLYERAVAGQPLRWSLLVGYAGTARSSSGRLAELDLAAVSLSAGEPRTSLGAKAMGARITRGRVTVLESRVAAAQIAATARSLRGQ